MNAFLTGSRIYGTPREDSDIDLVILTDEATVELLEAEGGMPCKFGKLNVIAFSDEDEFDRWRAAKDACVEESESMGGPLVRALAVAIHKKICRDTERALSESDSKLSDFDFE